MGPLRTPPGPEGPLVCEVHLGVDCRLQSIQDVFSQPALHALHKGMLAVSAASQQKESLPYLADQEAMSGWRETTERHHI